ncbi:hypothetical protein BD560DRAFT_454479 [Blakeslea trispora]|nr:hypothetical protein BD560DRAFT_454479 [Blakeslea trispora]
MRRAYQKAVTIPLNNVEHLWKEYDQWENNLNRLTAKKFLGEKSSAYMTARTALREMRLFTDNINTNTVPLPPQWTPAELNQLDLWKKYIEWEKSDPLQLEDENAIMERVAYAYQQAFLVLRFYPEIWYSFANYYQALNKPEKALYILKQGIEILPTSLLLNFSYAELCESRRQLDEAREAYDQLTANLDKESEALKSTSQQEIARITQEAEEERAAMNLSDDIDGELREQLRSRERHVKREQEAIESKLNEQVDAIARAGSLVWINYMRFARRSDGIKSARALFSRARKATNCTYHVYVADALMEYHNSKDANIAGKVFSLGQKSFANNPDFVCQYLDFLIQMNDDNNTRALFERTLATMPAEKASAIWLKFLEYENKYGDLASVQSVEKRRVEAMSDPAVNTTESFLKRHSYLDIRTIEEKELGYTVGHPLRTEATLVKDETAQAQPQQQAQPQPQQPTSSSSASASKEHQKRPLLEPVHPEKYPRPDLGQWQAFKPTARPANASPIITTIVPGPPVETASPSVPPPAAPSQPMVPSSAVMPPTQPQAMSGNSGWMNNSPMHSVPPVGPSSSPAAVSLPDAVAYFVSNLPPAQTFNGPIISPIEIVDLLRTIIIPLPPQQAQPSRPMMNQPKPPMPNRDMPPRNYGARPQGGPNPGRLGGFKGRPGPPNQMQARGNMGNKSNMKRRGRDDYDDDYQPHKGMGPNRPPDFDLFRQRQAKRHRDDPPY